ncbi:DUF461 domain-containing protein [Streptomyces sp. NPDC020681]|uniref:DUF461 domain-containing protein n=1 Tax=Streptomyces sp. NPDC020681 TaxID=3365083 RepID=UPI00379BE411
MLSVAALTACAAGNSAETLGVKPDNAEVTVDTIKIQNAIVIVQPTADTEGPATVSATVFNNGSAAQTIDSITLPGSGAEVKLSAAGGSGPVTVPAQGSVLLGGKGNASAVIENGRELTKNTGGVQELVVRLSETGDVKMQAFVVPAESYAAGFGPSSLPKPPAEPQEGESKPAVAPSESATGHAGEEGEPAEPGNGESGEPGTPSDSSSASHSEAGH